jgi:hypothetical protein
MSMTQATLDVNRTASWVSISAFWAYETKKGKWVRLVFLQLQVLVA